MSGIAPATRRRLEIQGFVGIDDATLAEVAPWLRFSPAVCTVWMATGTVLASPVLLWTLAAIALLGAILPFHPFDLAYDLGIRHLARTRRLPRNGPPRRFACALAAVWLAATGWAFNSGATVTGYVLGGLLTAVAALVSTTDICIPSLVYRALFGRKRADFVATPR